MSSEPTKTPNRRRLLVIALVALTSAGGGAVYGIIQRAHSAAQVAQWTDQQAIPTVALVSLQGGPQVRKLILPGTIQA
jgi:membrane fusion protein, multidrug efflux system